MTARDDLAEVLRSRPQDIVVCYSKCWPCNFGEHSNEWHTWADEEDVEHAVSSGRPDPSSQRCGCYCQKEAAK